MVTQDQVSQVDHMQSHKLPRKCDMTGEMDLSPFSLSPVSLCVSYVREETLDLGNVNRVSVIGQ
jgi:hypothetical protein